MQYVWQVASACVPVRAHVSVQWVALGIERKAASERAAFDVNTIKWIRRCVNRIQFNNMSRLKNYNAANQLDLSYVCYDISIMFVLSRGILLDTSWQESEKVRR